MTTPEPPKPPLERLDLAEGTITYRTFGAAESELPTVVFVHGLLVDGQLWAGVADRLAQRGIRSVVPNWPTGSHPVAMRAQADLSPRGIAATINRFLDALGLTEIILVGNDTGGALCQFLIDADSSRIGRLVLTNCDAFDVFPPKEFDGLMKIGRSPTLLKPLLSALRLSSLRHAKNVYGGTIAGEPDPVVTRSWIEPGASSHAIRQDTAKLIRGIDSADLLDVSSRLARYKRPVYLVWGDADPFFSLAFGRRLAAAFTDARLTVVPGASTFVPMEFPDAVADVIATASAERL